MNFRKTFFKEKENKLFKEGEQEDQGKLLNEAVQGINDYGIGYLVTYSLHMVAQSHIWHLLCPSGQKHMALGEFYDEIQSEVDELAEKFIAQGGYLTDIEPYKYNCKYNELEIYNYINNYRTHITNVIENSMGAELKSIQDSVIDLQEVIDEFLYKFKLD